VLQKPNEEVQGLTADPIRKTYWVYTNQSLFELDSSNEHRDIWKIYLEKGKFEIALKYAKVYWTIDLSVVLFFTDHFSQTASQRDHILSAQAKAFFDEGRFFQAAQCYAQCSVTFEEVTLKFLDAGERDALRSYLISRLERTRKAVRLMVYPAAKNRVLNVFIGYHQANDAGYLAGRVLPQQVQ
jgi:hypothetical protein